MTSLIRLARRRPALAVLVAAMVVILLALAGATLGSGVLGERGGGTPRAAKPSASVGTAGPTPSPGSRTSARLPVPSPTPSVSAGQLIAGRPVTCPAPSTRVSSTDQLTRALAGASAGDVIALAAGVYRGEFVAKASGSAAAPIFLCGPRNAVLDGGDTSGGYVLHLDHVASWRVVGFSIRNGQKGVMADGVTDSVIQGLSVSMIGDEGVHLRDASTNNVVSGNTVTHTGLRKAKFGEGIYVGTARKNWCKISACKPDRSDHNVIRDNTIADTTSENVDIKEGTSAGTLVGNHLDGRGTTAADSVVDVKGDRWVVEGNRARDVPVDGFQTHQILDGWGDFNVFRGNIVTASGGGYGIAVTPALANVVSCGNSAPGARRGMTNTTCR